MRTTSLTLALLVAGCQTTGNVLSSLPGGYTSDTSDACYAERVALDQSGSTFETELFRNVLVGAVAGGVTALATGRNVFLGAGLGAAASAAGTYLYNLQSQTSDPVQLTATAIENVRKENQQVDQMLNRFQALRKCRQVEAGAIRANVASGKLTRADGETQMEAVKARYQRDLEQLDAIAKNISNRSESYATVYNQIAADNGGTHLDATSRSGGPATGTTNRNANLRAQAGTNHEIVGRASAGTVLTILGSSGDWFRVRNPSGGEAYIAKSLIGDLPASVASNSSRAQAKPAEKPIKDDQIKPIVLPKKDQEKVGELREVSLANVEKRDQVNDQIATAKADADQEFTLS